MKAVLGYLRVYLMCESYDSGTHLRIHSLPSQIQHRSRQSPTVTAPGIICSKILTTKAVNFTVVFVDKWPFTKGNDEAGA